MGRRGDKFNEPILMGRHKQRSLDYKSTGTGEIIRVPTQEHSDAADSVLQFFALLAYPHVSERPERDKAAEVLHAAMYKARIWDRRHDRSIRMRLPLADRQMKIRVIQQQLSKWKKRINRRLCAGNQAARFYYKGRFIPFITPQSSACAGIYIDGPRTTRESLKDLVTEAEKKGIYRGRDDAVENERKQMWLPSMPVLHLCLIMFEMVHKFDRGTDFEKITFELHAHPEWLHDALLRAEGLRMVLHECVPENRFDPNKAVRMLPTESLPEIKP